MNYLGQIVSASGYRLDPANVEAVLSLKKSNPSTVGEVRKLLGLLDYYRRYIPNFARTACTLYQLLHADPDNVARTVRGNKQHSKRGSVPSSKPVVWGEQHQKALEKLLDHLTSAPVYPDFSQPFGKMRVIGYGSWSLTKAERNFHLHSGKLEFLALKWAVCQHFRDYLYYAPHFVIYTDNNPLTYMLTTAKLNAAGHRWVSELGDFSFTIKYRPGHSNKDADALPRMPVDIGSYEKLCTECLLPAGIMAVFVGLSAQQHGETTWVSAVSVDDSLLDFDNELTP